MAILRSVDGKLYNVPDSDLSRFEVPADKVSELMAEMGTGEAGGGEGPGGDVEPYHHRYRRRHYWRNHWNNCWLNCY